MMSTVADMVALRDAAAKEMFERDAEPPTVLAFHPSLPQPIDWTTRYGLDLKALQLPIPSLNDEAALPANIPAGKVELTPPR
jgi:hypothetical protein